MLHLPPQFFKINVIVDMKCGLKKRVDAVVEVGELGVEFVYLCLAHGDVCCSTFSFKSLPLSLRGTFRTDPRPLRCVPRDLSAPDRSLLLALLGPLTLLRHSGLVLPFGDETSATSHKNPSDSPSE